MYIRAHLYCKISLPQLSKVASLSLSHLSHLFKENFEVGPIAYHRRCRLQAAADQLSRTSQSIQEIAYDFGFDNALNFSRAFNEEFNTSPKFYRKA
jgi:AraC family transcriptional regulator of arabinose operon